MPLYLDLEAEKLRMENKNKNQNSNGNGGKGGGGSRRGGRNSAGDGWPAMLSVEKLFKINKVSLFDPLVMHLSICKFYRSMTFFLSFLLSTFFMTENIQNQ